MTCLFFFVINCFCGLLNNIVHRYICLGVILFLSYLFLDRCRLFLLRLVLTVARTLKLTVEGYSFSTFYNDFHLLQWGYVLFLLFGLLGWTSWNFRGLFPRTYQLIRRHCINSASTGVTDLILTNQISWLRRINYFTRLLLRKNYMSEKYSWLFTLTVVDFNHMFLLLLFVTLTLPLLELWKLF